MPVSAWIDLAPGKGEPEWAALGREFKRCKRSFVPHVASWQAYAPPTPLNWHKVEYDSNQAPIDRRGVYAFVLDAAVLSPGFFPPMSLIMYVGESGDTSNATLRTRLRGYRNKKAQRDRARLWAMLEEWGEHLDFYYSEVPDGTSTKTCETALLDALLPPANKKDFSSTVRHALDYAFN